MNHVIEPAPSSRASCRGCGEKLDKGALRFGERAPNAFGEGEVTYWFHPRCAALKRPEALLEALAVAPVDLPDRDGLQEMAQEGVVHRRLPRLVRAERASSGRASCRSCREAIPKGTWRFALALFEDGRMQPIGFIHAFCAKPYFGTTALVHRIDHELSAADRTELERDLAAPAPAPKPLVKTTAADPDGEAETPDEASNTRR